MFKKILVPYDGSDGAKLALAKAGEIAQVNKGEIHVLTVGRIPEHAETASKAEKTKNQDKAFYSEMMEGARVLLKKQGLNARTRMEFGKPET